MITKNEVDHVLVSVESTFEHVGKNNVDPVSSLAKEFLCSMELIHRNDLLKCHLIALAHNQHLNDTTNHFRHINSDNSHYPLHNDHTWKTVHWNANGKNLFNSTVGILFRTLSITYYRFFSRFQYFHGNHRCVADNHLDDEKHGIIHRYLFE